jgi:putative CocE/NonD family hydrolase
VEQYSKIDIPVLTITGYFDDDQYGALRYYKEHRKHASSDGKENHYLLIGPWDHKGTQRPQAEYHGLRFDESSKLDISQLQIDWLNWVLNNAEKPVILKRNVNYYVMGEEVWRHTDSLVSLSIENRKFYLSSPNSEASDVFNSGLLSEKQSNKKDVDSYFYDPLDNYDLKVPKSAFDYGGMWSQKAAFANNILIYHSAPLSEEIIIAGQVSFTASISMNVPDTDMKVYLFAIMPDGQSLRIATDVMRARYRNGLTREELVPIGKVQKYVFDAFRLSARKLPKGARLRLVLTALDDYNYEKNYNSGKPNSEQSGEDAVTAKIKLHLGKGRTFLTLPVDTRNYELENKD